jgi:hypothetical protein
MGYYWCPPLRIQQIHCSVIIHRPTGIRSSRMHMQWQWVTTTQQGTRNQEIHRSFICQHYALQCSHASDETRDIGRNGCFHGEVCKCLCCDSMSYFQTIILLTFIEWAISWLHQVCVSKSWQGYEIDDAAAATRRDSCAHIDDPIFHQVQRWHPPTCKTKLFWRADSMSLALIHG